MRFEKLEWMKKITAKQVVAMCIGMVGIYFVALLGMNHNNVPSDYQTNRVGSMGYPYEDEVDVDVETQTVFVLHESGYIVKTEIELEPELSYVESIFYGISHGSQRLAENLEGLIPSRAVLRDYDVDSHGVLTLNLSESFTYYRNSIEVSLLSSLVWSLTELPNVEKVHFTIEGEPVSNFNTSIDVGRGLTRAMGINLEVATHRITDSQPVLLYFFTNDSENALLIPVTRLIDSHAEPFEYAVSSLVRGPIGASYISVFNHRATLLESPKLTDGIMTLNFCSELFFDQDQTHVSSQLIKQLVMTMTEFSEVHEVSVVIEGSSRVFDDVGNPLTVPVSRDVILGNEARFGSIVRQY